MLFRDVFKFSEFVKREFDVDQLSGLVKDKLNRGEFLEDVKIDLEKISEEGLTLGKLEEEFIDVLIKVLDVWLFLNYRKVWKEVREYVIGLVNKDPF